MSSRQYRSGKSAGSPTVFFVPVNSTQSEVQSAIAGPESRIISESMKCVCTSVTHSSTAVFGSIDAAVVAYREFPVSPPPVAVLISAHTRTRSGSSCQPFCAT